MGDVGQESLFLGPVVRAKHIYRAWSGAKCGLRAKNTGEVNDVLRNFRPHDSQFFRCFVRPPDFGG